MSAVLTIDLLTLFPAMVSGFIRESILGSSGRRGDSGYPDTQSARMGGRPASGYR